MSVALAYRCYGPVTAPWLYVMAPGDCGELSDASGTVIAEALAQRGVRVIRFAAPVDGTDADWAEAITMFASTRTASQHLVVGGQSRGARVSVSLAENLDAHALLLWSYPFHPRRCATSLTALDALIACRTPVWLCQGSRDALGNREQVRGYSLPDTVQVHWVEDGNHDLVPRERSGLQREGVLRVAVDAVAEGMLRS
ncbi:MAG: putative alpha/beta-hydrolase family hydrolase [Myxococcota bacterium]